MGVSSGNARVSDLAFRVYDRAIHPDWFATRAWRRVSLEGWEADIRIIDGGHAVTWRGGPSRLTEVLAGPETCLPGEGLLFEEPIRRERVASLKPAGAVTYQASLEVERLDAEVFAHLCDELTLDPTRGDLFRRSSPADRLAPAPLCRVHVEARARSLSVQSFHTFPSERAIVRTQSLFDLQLALPAR